MIFQDPLASLNPCFTVAFQLMETLRIHEGGSAKARRARALELLQQVEIPDAATRLNAFPHQLSGGMAQRVMIAMAIACNPKLLIADEPSTALDVTVQAQILALLTTLQRERGMALMLITHDLAVVAETAQRVVVMYAGQQVETGPVPQIFETPQHPYTQALLAALPEHNIGRRAAAGDSRRRAGPARSSHRLPPVAALRLRDRPLPARATPARGNGRPPRPLSLRARRRGAAHATGGAPKCQAPRCCRNEPYAGPPQGRLAPARRDGA